MRKVIHFIVAITMIASYTLTAQVAVNADGTAADPSSMLDVKSTDKGMLIPQIALTGENDATTIATPATSLLVYNTATVTGLTPGYYYNSGTIVSPVWTRLVSGVVDGSETKVTAGTNVNVTGAGTTERPYVVNASGSTTLTIGQSYQGGIIFWLDATGQHGLIEPAADHNTGIQWYNGTYTVTNAVRNGIEAGKFNTERIITNQGAGAYAAQICANYQGGNYGDWYLPSKYELNLLNLQKSVVGGFSIYAFYWSSGEYNTNAAWLQTFGSDIQSYGTKSNTGYVRAVRAF